MDKTGITAFGARNLSCRFEDAAADVLGGIDFDIAAGSFVSIIGPNGAGKSTLMDILLGYNKSYGGSAEFFGKQIRDCGAAELAAKRAYIPQQSEEGLRLTAYEYLKLANADPRNTKDEDISEILDKFNIAYLKDQNISLMSGGESRLAQLAFALLRKPEALLLDEPVSYLDYKNQQIFFDTLKKERGRRPMTVVSILHDLNLAAYYSDAVMLVNEGRILKYGPPTEVLNYKTLGSVFFGGVSGAGAHVHTKEPRARVHVICGGGSGEKIISKLISMNFSVSCGVLNAGDSDWRFCRANSVEMIEEEPYRPIGEQNYARNIEAIKKSRAVVVCEFPLGSGNLANLRFIDEIGGMNDIRIFCAEGGGTDGGACRGLDFTGGAADGYIKKIRARASLFGSAEDLEKLIDTL
ncbi:MAG TPA: hypothetical protein DC017_07245 [Candidatus Wallbacteria bacterium]|nr:hypothetical protein [Candidatus Wallbacteria bacterium]